MSLASLKLKKSQYDPDRGERDFDQQIEERLVEHFEK